MEVIDRFLVLDRIKHFDVDSLVFPDYIPKEAVVGSCSSERVVD